MKQLTKFLRLDFLPRSTDLALLALRLWVGLSMLLLHGWGKVTGFDKMSGKFLDLLGIGSKASLVLAIFGKSFAPHCWCSVCSHDLPRSI